MLSKDINTEIEEGDIVLCTVDRIVGTNVFVKIHLNNKEVEGSIVFSEVASGRIRNIRDYVVPKKKIACKVLRIQKGGIELSLRRVTQEEQKEVKKKYELEKNYERIIKSIVGEKAEKIIEKIKEKQKVYDFLQKAKDSPKEKKELEKLTGKENAKKIIEIIKTQRQKKSTLKKEIFITTSKSDGIDLIKELLKELSKKIKDSELKYMSAGYYILKKETEDMKKADRQLRSILADFEKKAKSKGIEFSTQKSKD